MKCQRLNELIALLHTQWQAEPGLSLMQLIQKLAQEAGFKDELVTLSDDTLIYHMKMRHTDAGDIIPGLKKDYEDDFKTAILRARGIVKDSTPPTTD